MLQAAKALEVHNDLRALNVLQLATPISGKDKRDTDNKVKARTQDIKNMQYEMERILYGERETEAPSHKPMDRKLKSLAGKGKVLPMTRHSRDKFKKPEAAK